MHPPIRFASFAFRVGFVIEDAGGCGAVVASENNDGASCQLKIIHCTHQLANQLIHVGDVPGVERGLAFRWIGFVERRGGVRSVGEQHGIIN